MKVLQLPLAVLALLVSFSPAKSFSARPSDIRVMNDRVISLSALKLCSARLDLVPESRELYSAIQQHIKQSYPSIAKTTLPPSPQVVRKYASRICPAVFGIYRMPSIPRLPAARRQAIPKTITVDRSAIDCKINPADFSKAAKRGLIALEGPGCKLMITVHR